MFNNREIGVNSLSLTILDLIAKNITMRISSKGELKTSETFTVNLVRTLNKSKKFNLRDMLKQTSNVNIANKFKKDFMEFKNVVQIENDYSPKKYRNVMDNARFTTKGKELKNKWSDFQSYLKSKELSEKYHLN